MKSENEIRRILSLIYTNEIDPFSAERQLIRICIKNSETTASIIMEQEEEKEKIKEEVNIEKVEKLNILKALKYYKGNRSKTARAINISERTLYRKIIQYNIGKCDWMSEIIIN